MSATSGNGAFSFEIVEDWAHLPEGWSFKEVAAVGVDAKGRVYCFTRGAHPIIVFDRDGNFVTSWGEGLFTRAHGLTMGPDETIYCTDDGDHTVRKCTLDGKVLLTLGTPSKPAQWMSGHPFNRCTHVAICPKSNDIFVTDGYCNARVHKYTPEGKLVLSWGEPGTDPGQFNIVHNISTDKDGLVYVADRENHRVQIFDGNGKYQGQWVNMARPCGLHIGGQEEQYCYIGELGAGIGTNEGPGLGPRVSIYDMKGQVIARVGDLGPGEGPGQFIAPHGIGLDSNGDIYVGEVSWTVYGSLQEPPREVRTLQKLVRLKE